MRLWSIHPKYLDAKGLVALWREGLLAKKVLENKTRGYRNHPQLERFKRCADPIATINTYLHFVCDESERRGYLFDRTKLGIRKRISIMCFVKKGQVDYEWSHLLKKLKVRSPEKFEILKTVKRPAVHPIFKKHQGGVESWEILY